MNKITASNYIQPTPKPCLNYELGLDSNEIAISLGVDHHKVKEKIKRNSWRGESEKIGFVCNHGNTIVFDLFSAIIFAARWKSVFGKKYYLFLEDFILKLSNKQRSKVFNFGDEYGCLFFNPPKIQGNLTSYLYLINGSTYCKFGISAVMHFDNRIKVLKKYFKNPLNDCVKEILVSKVKKPFDEYFELEQKIHRKVVSFHKNEWYLNKHNILNNDLTPEMISY